MSITTNVYAKDPKSGAMMKFRVSDVESFDEAITAVKGDTGALRALAVVDSSATNDSTDIAFATPGVAA